MNDSKQLLEAKIALLEQEVVNLNEGQKQLELVIQSTGVGIWDWHVQTGLTSFNERWANIIGYTLKELEPISIQTWLDYAHPDDLIESERLLKEHWAGKSDYYIFESRMKHKNGEWIWVLDTGQVIEWESPGVPKRMIGTHLDVTEKHTMIEQLHTANSRLKRLSYFDELLNIPNRRAYKDGFKRESSRAKRTKKPLSLIMLDVDYFKGYNDTYGHIQGDKALQTVARSIQNSLSRGTDMLARYGGEEFVVLLPETDLAGAINIAQRIKDTLAQAGLQHSASSYGRLTVSMGISSSDKNFTYLLEQADMAMYQAKKNGRNRYEVCYSDEHELPQ